jgi:Ca-activated chloride channel family protein
MTRAAIVSLVAAVAVASPAAQRPTFRAAVDVVRIDASVMNGRSAVGGLTKDHFAITDNGVPQAIDSVTLDRVPLSLLLVFDTSESLLGAPFTALIAATHRLIDNLRPDEAATLVTFSDQVRVAVPTTYDRAPLRAALNGLTAAGATSINDAIVLSLLHRPPSTPDTRPVMLVFSDGLDTASWLKSGQAQAAVRRSGMLVHVVELRTRAGATNFAREVARAGGGRAWSATSAGALRELFGQVLDELRARYLITYYPSGVSREGWHDVKVTLKNTRGDVTARPGYFAALP